MIARFTLCALALIATGCQTEGEPAPVAPTHPATSPTLPETIQAAGARMHGRLEAARRIQLDVVHSDLASAQREARTLRDFAEPEMLAHWRPYLDRVSDAARQIEQAPDVVRAAKTAAGLGRECARCHDAMAAHIVFPVAPRPPESRKLQPEMLGHEWAAARMWEGLIGPSDERWGEGARALTQIPLAIVADQPREVPRQDWTLPDADKVGDDVARVRLYANRALAERDQDARAAVFGDLLATCAHCHAVIRDR